VLTLPSATLRSRLATFQVKVVIVKKVKSVKGEKMGAAC
jgi:hypothetical protein